MRIILMFLIAALTTSCALTPAMPPEPTSDPLTMASIRDYASEGQGSPRGTRFFVVSEVNGKPTTRDARSASIMASRGMGFRMQVVDVERAVGAGMTKLKLRGSIGFSAPIQDIFAAVTSGGEREVVGVIDVDVKPGIRYRVNGVIDELRSEVWLEDPSSGQVVPGTRIAATPTPEAMKAVSSPMTFTCCNLHYDRDRWISDANWLEQPFVPAGTPVRVYEIRSDRAKVLIDDKVAWLGLDYGRKQQAFADYLARLTVKDDPAQRIKGYSAEVQAAVRVGKALIGMTKEEAVVALGYPRADLTPSITARRWSFMTASEEPFFLVWSTNDRLQSVEATGELRNLVLYVP